MGHGPKVCGTEPYATYETPDGFPAVYDDALGLFRYAWIDDGGFQSTWVPAMSPPAPSVEQRTTEFDAVRRRKIEARTPEVNRRSQGIPRRATWGALTPELADTESSRALLEMLPVTLEMRDHLRQEETGELPASLPQAERQLDFASGTLAFWASTDFVIYDDPC